MDLQAVGRAVQNLVAGFKDREAIWSLLGLRSRCLLCHLRRCVELGRSGASLPRVAFVGGEVPLRGPLLHRGLSPYTTCPDERLSPFRHAHLRACD